VDQETDNTAAAHTDVDDNGINSGSHLSAGTNVNDDDDGVNDFHVHGNGAHSDTSDHIHRDVSRVV
jgi:hypothetical protein